MLHRERVRSMKDMHRSLLGRIEGHDPSKLPKGANRKKLEAAYDSLKGYSFVLKKK